MAKPLSQILSEINTLYTDNNAGAIDGPRLNGTLVDIVEYLEEAETSRDTLGPTAGFYVVEEILADPPGVAPALGTVYLIGDPATGVWLEHPDEIVVYSLSGWIYVVPQEGMEVYNQATSSKLIYDGDSWEPYALPVSDHGGLTGLGDDDHTQYHNDSRGDARYSPLGHDHGTLYYTEAEVNALLADFAPLVHTHDDRYYTQTEVDNLLGGYLPTGSTFDDRYYTEGEVDTLLTAKAELVHTHDDRYFTETEVTDALALKSDSSHTHDDRYYTQEEVDALVAAPGDQRRVLDDCEVAMETNVSINSPGDTYSSVTMVSGYRMCLAGQTDETENGVYVWTGVGVPMARATDFDDSLEIFAGVIIPITLGDNAGALFLVITGGTIIPDTTPITIVEVDEPAAALFSFRVVASFPFAINAQCKSRRLLIQNGSSNVVLTLGGVMSNLDEFEIQVLGTGTVTLSPSVNVYCAGGLVLTTQYELMHVKRRTGNTWYAWRTNGGSGGGGGGTWGSITGTLSAQTDLQAALDGKAAVSHTHLASAITDFDTEVANNSAVTANTAKVSNATHTGDVTGATALTLDPSAISGKATVTAVGGDYLLISDTSDGGNLKKALASDLLGSGSAVWGAITGTLSAQTDLQSALDGKAPSLGADDNYVTDAEKVVIGNTSGTNTGDQTSIVGITGTKAEFNTACSDGNFIFVGDAPTSHTHTASEITDFDTEVANNSAVTANTAKVTNATHTGDVTGATALTIDPSAITGKSAVTADGADYILISDASDSGNLKKALISGLPAPASTTSIIFVIDGGGSAITTGVKGDIGPIPFACTITEVTALADQTGSIVVDVWKDSYTNFPPLDADSITASAPVTISAAAKAQDSTLTGWTTSISAGDSLRFNVDSVSTITRLTIAIEVSR